MANVFQGALDVLGRQRIGAPGDSAAYSDSDRTSTAFNSSPEAVQITTVTMTDQGDDDDVIITINGYDVEYNTGTGLALAAIGAAFAAAINGDERVRGDVRASFDTATLTLTGLTPGETFTVSIASDPDSVLSAVTTTQAAAESAAIPAGRLCIVQTNSDAHSAEELCAIAKSSLLTAQVITFTCTYVASAIVKASIYEIRGSERVHLGSGIFVSATDLNATLDGLAAAINTALAANTVLAASTPATATDITLTAEVLGLEFDVELEHVSGGASSPVFTKTYTTGPSPLTSIARAALGVSQRPNDEEVSTIGGTDPEWPGSAGVRLWKESQVIVESDEAITNGGTVYVELGVTADNGQFFAADSATRLALPKAMAEWRRDGGVSAHSVAVVRLNIP